MPFSSTLLRRAALVCALATSSLLATSWAQSPLGAPRPPVVEGVAFSTYSGPRVGDIAPEWTLPDGAGTLRSSRDLLNRDAVILVLVGRSPVLVGKNTTPQKVIESVVSSARQLATSHVSVFAVSYATGVELRGLNPAFDQMTLRDTKGVLGEFFHPSPTGLTLVAVDRAGFLRGVETLAEASTAGARLLQIGDCTPKLEVGQVAPDFSISDMNGQVRRLSELRGRKNLLLTFFPKCFTGGCANHLTSLRDEADKFAASDTEVWAVSVDPAEGDQGQIAFARSLTLPFPMLPDTGRNLSLLYQAARRPYSLAYRRSLLIDKNGVLRVQDKQVNVFTHGPDVLSQMQRLGLSR